MRIVSLVMFCLCGGGLLASEWRPDDEFLNVIRQIESSGGRFLYGDRGRSLGDFQMGKLAWADVTAWRKARRLPTYSYSGHALKPDINRMYAADYLVIVRQRLQAAMRREPTPAEIYAGYNMGVRRFAECGYDLARVNSVTASKCRQITFMLERSRSLAATESARSAKSF